MNIYNVLDLALKNSGEYVLGSSELHTHAGYFIYGILNPDEKGRLIKPGRGHEEIVCIIRGEVLLRGDKETLTVKQGQASPTSMEGMITKNQPFGVFSEQLNPMVFAVALDCSFVARGFAGDPVHLKGLMKEAINHRGFALVDILQPCVIFNKVNTYEWYKQRVYPIEPEYNPEDKMEAFKKALEWGERIPIGVIYRNHRQTFEERIPTIKDKPLVKQFFEFLRVEATMKEFY